MNYINFISKFYDKFFVENKILIKILFIVVVMLYMLAATGLCLNSRLFPDYDTSYFWFNEMIVCANQIINAGIVPIILFELFLHKEKSTS